MAIALVGFQACTALKFVPEGQKLYTGARIETVKKGNVGKTNAVVEEGESMLRPKPNSSVLGFRFGLWWYYKTEDKTGKLGRWLHKKLAQEPVYLSSVKPELVNRALEALLYNHGFFDSDSRFEVREKTKTASIVYTYNLAPAYRIRSISYPSGNDEPGQAFAKVAQESMLKVGRRYDLTRLVEERTRVLNGMKDLGFYFLSEEHLQFSADTSNGNRTVAIQLKVKPDAPEQSVKRYVVDQVNVNADYELGVEKSIPKELVDSVNYFSESHYVRPEPVVRSIFLRNGKTYNRTDHNLTYNRLMGLGIYKYVNVRLSKTDSSGPNPALTANILLIPLPRKSLSAEIQGVSKSNNFIGPGLNFSLRNRNAFRGAELLVLGLRTSFETQLNGPYKGRFTYELNPKVELYIPRFLTPFKIRPRILYVPKTKFIFDYTYLSRINYFNINSFKFSFGYKWKNSLAVDHDLSLLNITYFNIGSESEDFLQLTNGNPILKRRFEKQLIGGLSYSFFYNEQVYPEKQRPFYLNVNFESAGNAISAYHKLLKGEIANSENPLTVGNVVYAQFARLDVDVRQYFFFGKGRQQTFATRFIAGWGLPFGNSSTMPYIKQFFSGGAYSVRGFPAFSIGPGTYSPPDSVKALFFLQQGGEIKLEINAEYRFPIFSVVKGALFADAGNTWLNRNNPDIPGGRFGSNFYKELAASMGFGLRADVQFFVLRLDLGIPVRKPWYPDGKRWVFNEFDLSSGAWRRNNLILNLAFGYPF